MVHMNIGLEKLPFQAFPAPLPISKVTKSIILHLLPFHTWNGNFMARSQKIYLEDTTAEYTKGTSAWHRYCYCLQTQKKKVCLPQHGMNEHLFSLNI